MTTSWTTETKTGNTSYIQTDTPDFVLLGQNEDEFLVWEDMTSWTNVVKS